MDDLKEIQQKSSQAYEALVKDAGKVMAEIADVPDRTRFREEYESLHAALKKSHDNERRLIKKSRELNSEI